MSDHRPSDPASVHRALASPVRNRILVALRDGEAPQDVHRLAAELGLHPNTVRVHLTVLERAGLVTSQPEGRDRPGRPRLVYRAVEPVPEAGAGGVAESHGYRFLAEVLASYLAATAPDPTGAAEEAGTAWGRHLVERPGPFQRLEPDAAVDRVVAMLDELGFAPELDAGDAELAAGAGDAELAAGAGDAELAAGAGDAAARVLLRRCPFLDVAKEHQDVVCGIHLGLMRGALDELGVEVEARDLIPFVEPNLCVSHLGVPA